MEMEEINRVKKRPSKEKRVSIRRNIESKNNPSAQILTVTTIMNTMLYCFHDMEHSKESGENRDD